MSSPYSGATPVGTPQDFTQPAQENYAAWRADGVQIPEGGFFENLTVTGWPETAVHAGDVFRIECKDWTDGQVRNETTRYLQLNFGRTFKFGRQSVDAGLGIFNVFNTANFDNPNATFGTANFGRITAAQPMRQIQLGARVTF